MLSDAVADRNRLSIHQTFQQRRGNDNSLSFFVHSGWIL